MSRLQSWLTFAFLSVAVFMLYLLGVFEYLPFVGDQFSTGQRFVRLVILASLVLFFLIVARVIASLRDLTAERQAIEQASLIADKPSQQNSDSPEVDFAELLAELPRDGLLASRVDLLTTYLDEHATTDEVCLLLARQSGLDNEYGDLVFSSELVLLGLMNLIGITGVIVLLSEVVTGLIAAMKQTGEFRAQAAELIPPMGSVLDIMVVVAILSGVARLLVRIPQRRQRLAVIAADELALYLISKSKLPSQRSMAAEESPSPPFDGLELSEAVERAFAMAAKASDPDSPLQTAPFLATLARTDTSGRWDRLELEVGDMSQLPSQLYLDPAPSSDRFGMVWQESLRLSDTLVDALMLCDKICRDYEMEIVHPGVVALALLADPRSGASRCLLSASKLSHSRVTESVQEELIGRSLEGIDRLMQSHLRGVDRSKADSAAG